MPGYQRMKTLALVLRPRRAGHASEQRARPIDRLTTFDKLTNVHYSGTAHEEDQPSHLHRADRGVQLALRSRSTATRASRFCPANVYEIIRETGQPPRLQINASNCVHCKTCDIMDPYQVITWVPPEGGGGPQYNGM